MPSKKYTTGLSEEERKQLKQFINSPSKKNTPQCKVHAKIILCLDQDGEKPLTPEQTAEKCKVHRENVYKIRKQFVAEDMKRILNRKKRETPSVPPKITGGAEAHIIAAACSTALEGRKSWTMQL